MSAAPTLAIYDPADRWSVTLPGFTVPPESPSTVRVERHVVEARRIVREAPLPLAHAALVLPPQQGLATDQHARLARLAVPGFEPWALPVVRLDDEDFDDESRAGTGYRQIAEECARQFRLAPVLIPPGEDDLVERILRLALRVASAGQRRAELLRERGATWAAAWRHLGEPVPAPGSLDGLAAPGRCVLCARALRDQFAGFGRALSQLAADEQQLAHRWQTLADHGLERCRARVRKVRFHGSGAEEILGDLIGKVGTIRDRLEHEWPHAPTRNLRAWAEAALDAAQRPEVVLPVAGVFSTGKTTLFNHILGKTPAGHALLRTSRGHNTALLTRFHSTSPGEEDRVELRWRERVTIDLLRVGDPAARPMVAPFDGSVVGVFALSSGVLVELQGRDGTCTVHVGAEKQLERWVRVGARVKADQRLSSGVEAEAELHAFTELRTNARNRLRRLAAAHVLGFCQQRCFREAAFRVTWRQRDGHRCVLEEQTVTRGQPEWDEVVAFLERQTRRSQESELWIEPEGDRTPIQLSFSATLADETKHPTRHALASEADWSWFQGPVSDEDAQGAREAGFAESPASAWLVEQADVHLQTQICRYVSLIDTPGLNSISDQHDRVTEACIQGSSAFVLMFRVGADLANAKNDELLAMVASSLTAARVRRAEWRDRVFIVLNWFERRVGATTPLLARQSVVDFRKRIAHTLGIEAPRLYVVNLDPRRTARASEQLLEEPSLPVLQRDLGSFIGEHGIGARFADLSEELRRVFDREGAGLRQRQAELESGQVVDRVKGFDNAADALDEDGPLRQELLDEVKELFGGLSSAWNRFASALRADRENKDEFKELVEVGCSAAEQFNAVRAGLREELTDLVTGRLRARLAPLGIRPPNLVFSPALLDDVSPVAVESFRSRVRGVVRDWPGRLSRFGHLFTDFEYYGTTVARELREEFLDSPLSAIKEAHESVQARIVNACDGALADVRRALEKARCQSKDLAKALKRCEEELEQLHNFEHEVRWMRKRLESLAPGGAPRTRKAVDA